MKFGFGSSGRSLSVNIEAPIAGNPAVGGEVGCKYAAKQGGTAGISPVPERDGSFYLSVYLFVGLDQSLHHDLLKR